MSRSIESVIAKYVVGTPGQQYAAGLSGWVDLDQAYVWPSKSTAAEVCHKVRATVGAELFVVSLADARAAENATAEPITTANITAEPIEPTKELARDDSVEGEYVAAAKVFVLPATPAEADDALEVRGLAATSIEWQRSALVYARVHVADSPGRPTEKVNPDLLTPKQYAALGIHGLRSKTTVRRYWRMWQRAVEEGKAVPVKLGDRVQLPTVDWAEYFAPQQEVEQAEESAITNGASVDEEPAEPSAPWSVFPSLERSMRQEEQQPIVSDEQLDDDEQRQADTDGYTDDDHEPAIIVAAAGGGDERLTDESPVAAGWRCTIAAVDLHRLLHNGLLFAGRDDTLPMLVQVRLEFGAHQVLSIGTDRYCLGVTRAEYPDSEVREPMVVNLASMYAERVAKTAKTTQYDHSREGHPREVEVSCDGDKVTFAFCTGETLAFTNGDGFPKWRKVIPAKPEVTEAQHVGINPVALAKFAKVIDPDNPARNPGAQQRAMSMTLTTQGPVRPILVTIGESFIGILMPCRNQEPYTRSDWLDPADEQLTESPTDG